MIALRAIFVRQRCWLGTMMVVGSLTLAGTSTSVAKDKTTAPPPARRIGATTTVVEVTSGLPFPARVDTGATSCSIHYEALKIKNPSPEPKENVGKPVRILVKSPDGEKEWIKTKIADHVTVKTSEREDQRYKVPLKLRSQDVEKKVLVTLNDRETMKYPVLIGRNFLKGDFVVDVDLDYNDEHPHNAKSR